MEKIDWNALRDRAYKNACDHGFHEEKLSRETYFMLIITEISEAVEADRKGKHADMAFFNRKYKDYSDTRFGFERTIKGSVDEELADVIIRCLDLAGAYKIHLNVKYNSRVFTDDHWSYQTFAENAFELCKIVTDIENDNGLHLDTDILDIIYFVLDWCKYLGIDIMTHVHLKMEYNETRPYKNGEKY